MTDTLKISEFIQKFGLAFGKKHIYQTIQHFIERLSKAEACVFAFAQKDSGHHETPRFKADVIASSASAMKFGASEISELLGPVIIKYGVTSSSEEPSYEDIFDFEYFPSVSSARSPAARRSQNEAGINGSMLIPIFIDNTFFSVFAILSSVEFSLSP
ncbi:MAG TPA: hypothetical protein PKK26_19620, partial [Candidatus Wallbacteria bacterium]|nr:hypothetical protein [Candidatus Wallbacteria bacterium]